MKLKEFIKENMETATDKLLLNTSKYPDIDIRFAVEQINIRKHLKDKLPKWADNFELIFPSRLSAEQCSSELTASYKQNLLEGVTLCDLTGGLGIDCYYFSKLASQVFYIEKNKEYCDTAIHNFKTLKADNINVINGDSSELYQNVKVDTFYIDPARRSSENKRLFALSDCEPNILTLKDNLLRNSKRIIIKISPMADLTETLRLLPETTEIHILSIKNECKELLFVLKPNPSTDKEINIYTINYPSSAEIQKFSYKLLEEKNSNIFLASSIKKYLYEPNASLLKAGAFKLLSAKYNIEKLHLHSHLYTSDNYISDFPGRIFEVKKIYESSRNTLKLLEKEISHANITVRNFPMTVAEIRKRTHIKDGGNNFLFATTLANNTKVFILCQKA